jgi:hypothetical protein
MHKHTGQEDECYSSHCKHEQTSFHRQLAGEQTEMSTLASGSGRHTIHQSTACVITNNGSKYACFIRTAQHIDTLMTICRLKQPLQGGAVAWLQ